MRQSFLNSAKHPPPPGEMFFPGKNPENPSSTLRNKKWEREYAEDPEDAGGASAFSRMRRGKKEKNGFPRIHHTGFPGSDGLSVLPPGFRVSRYGNRRGKERSCPVFPPGGTLSSGQGITGGIVFFSGTVR